MSLIKDLYRDLPVYDNAEFAKGCEVFIFKAKTEEDCWKLYNKFLDSVPESYYVRAYRIGLRPDYPVPVSRYFMEVCVDTEGAGRFISFWTREDYGRLKR